MQHVRVMTTLLPTILTEEVEVTCTEAQWRAMPESKTIGRRCLLCIREGRVPAGRARYTHQQGSLCRWCLFVNTKSMKAAYKGLVNLQPISEI